VHWAFVTVLARHARQSEVYAVARHGGIRGSQSAWNPQDEEMEAVVSDKITLEIFTDYV